MRHRIKKSELRRFGRPLSFGLYDCTWSRYGIGYGKNNPFKCVPDYIPRWRQIIKAYKLMGVKWCEWDRSYGTSFEVEIIH